MTPPRLRNLLSFGLLGCATLSLVPLGCGATITNRAASEGPRVPDATAERLRACVDEFGGGLPRGYYTFDAAVKVDEEGGVIDVTSKGVPHADLAACMRIALRGMTVPEELLRVEKLRLPGSPTPASGQAPAERELVGHPGAIAVVVALAELAIQVGPRIVAIAAAVEITGEIAEVAWKRPKPNLNRCLDAAAAGGVMWENLCNAIRDPIAAAECWDKNLRSEQMKRNWCFKRFGK